MSPEHDDLTLLAAWRDGNARAGSALFERHFDAMYRFFRSKIDNGADDLVQQTFLACVRSRDAIRGDSTFRTYLYRVAKNKLYDELRKRLRNGDEVSLHSMFDLRTSPSTYVARNQQVELLRHALERLPLELQLAVELYYFEDRSAKEVAEILEMPVGTVRSRLRRAIESLRVHMASVAASRSQAARALGDLDEMLARRETHAGRNTLARKA